MPESWGMIIASVISGMFSGVVTGLVTAVKIVNSRMEKSDQKVEKLNETVDELKKERIEKLEITINDHVKSDKAQTVSTKIDNLIGTVNKMDDKLDRISEQVATNSAEIKANEKYIRNLDESHQRCKAAHKV